MVSAVAIVYNIFASNDIELSTKAETNGYMFLVFFIAIPLAFLIYKAIDKLITFFRKPETDSDNATE